MVITVVEEVAFVLWGQATALIPRLFTPCRSQEMGSRADTLRLAPSEVSCSRFRKEREHPRFSLRLTLKLPLGRPP